MSTRREATEEHVLSQLVARAGRDDWEEFSAQLQGVGGCAHPVRLRGSLSSVDVETGEVARLFSTDAQPDGVLLKACGHRRATRCPSCSETYKGDARAIVTAGLVGGKGMPEEVAEHPAVFLTLTAPSFGRVHTVRDGGARCHQGRGRCAHGLPQVCAAVHEAGDDVVGQALCPDCYDYEAAVVWNASLTALWKRTVMGARRSLARRAGMTVVAFEERARISYVKVVEFQRRGVVHLHCLVRLDMDDPPGAIDAAALGAALHVGALRARANNPLDHNRPIVWGEQIEVRPVVAALRPAVANYLAKYATKSTDDAGALDRPVTETSLELAALPEQLRRMAEAALLLGHDRRCGQLRLGRWAHTLGYRGHWVTKSQGWSTTFGRLREERHAFRREAARAGVEPTPGRVQVGAWEFAGRGYSTQADKLLAESVAAGRRAARRARWDA